MGRLYADSNLGGTEVGLQYSDYAPIAISHAQAITTACHNATAPITLIDTDFVTTQAFCQTYEGRPHPFVTACISEFTMDATIYLDNNVAWVADGLRRLGNARSQFAITLLKLYATHNIALTIIDDGDYHKRYLQAVAIIDDFLAQALSKD